MIRKLSVFCLVLQLLFFSCATAKVERSRGSLDVTTLMTAEESTWLPFEITGERVDEVKRWYGVTRVELKKYAVDWESKTTVPDWAVYKTAPRQKNEQAISGFIDYLKDPENIAALKNITVILCGPHLSFILKRSGILGSLDTKQVTFSLPRGEKQEVLIEYLVRGDSIPKVLNLLRCLLLIDDSFKVRRLNGMELRWYATIYQYDIIEPVFVFENRYHRICVHFDDKGRIFFIDLFENLKF